MMRKRNAVGTFLLLIIFVISIDQVFSQPASIIQKIMDSPDKFKDEVVTITGTVEQYIPSTATTSAYYLLKDDWGAIIAVRTTEGSPEVGKKYVVKGPVSYDPNGVGPSNYFISEDSRSPVGASVSPPPSNHRTNWLLIILIIVIGLLLIFALYLLFKGSSKPEETNEIKTKKIDGDIVNMHQPPPGTLKVLPGRLKVVGGESKLKEIRFFKTKDQVAQEITFGRNPGEPYKHIQLNSPTVSRLQAKIMFSNGVYSLINYSDVNPTQVNGKPLRINDIVTLSDGDKIAMGDVEFVYEAQ